MAAERDRLARELHDSVTQTLFSLTLAAESAAALAGGADPRLVDQLDQVRELARTGLTEMRGLVETLRPVDVAADGLAGALRKRVELLRRVHDVRIGLSTRGPVRLRDRTVEREVLMVAGEALANALQHADAGTVRVELDTRDAGPAGRRRRRGRVRPRGHAADLAPARADLDAERAEALGGSLEIDTAAGSGTTRAAGGARCLLSRCGCCSSTTTRWSGPGCGRSSACSRTWRWSARPASGEQALALVPWLRPDIVLLDLVLPGMSGLDVVRRLRAAHPG